MAVASSYETISSSMPLQQQVRLALLNIYIGLLQLSYSIKWTYSITHLTTVTMSLNKGKWKTSASCQLASHLWHKQDWKRVKLSHNIEVRLVRSPRWLQSRPNWLHQALTTVKLYQLKPNNSITVDSIEALSINIKLCSISLWMVWIKTQSLLCH